MGCTTLLVGKNASYDGSTIMARDDDSGSDDFNFKKFEVVTSMSIDSYPVGLEVSLNGKYVFTTSQGRSNGGGNCVDIFEVNILKGE